MPHAPPWSVLPLQGHPGFGLFFSAEEFHKRRNVGPIGHVVDHHRQGLPRPAGQEKVSQYLAGNVIGQAVNEESFVMLASSRGQIAEADFVYLRNPLVAIRTLSR